MVGFHMVWNRPIGSGAFGHVHVTVRETLVVFILSAPPLNPHLNQRSGIRNSIHRFKNIQRLI